jgi:hypothetical protein
MLEFSSKNEAPAIERDELFSLDGTVYTIPAHFSAGDTLTYVDGLRRYGPDIAAAWALEHALGQAGYTALCSADDATVPRAEFAKLIAIVTDRLLGKVALIPGPKAPAPATTKPRAPRGSKASTSK